MRVQVQRSGAVEFKCRRLLLCENVVMKIDLDFISFQLRLISNLDKVSYRRYRYSEHFASITQESGAVQIDSPTSRGQQRVAAVLL